MREIMKNLSEKKQILIREIFSRYLDHNPANRLSDGELKRHAKGKIEQFAEDIIRPRNK